jgi:hypothetical protein
MQIHNGDNVHGQSAGESAVEKMQWAKTQASSRNKRQGFSLAMIKDRVSDQPPTTNPRG